MSETIDFQIVDDLFKGIDTRSFLRGKELHDYDKRIIEEVIKHYLRTTLGETEAPTPSTKRGRKIFKFLTKKMLNDGIHFDDLMRLLRAENVEQLFAYLLLGFQSLPIDLIVRLTRTFGRVKPLNSKQEWFDNFRLNAYGEVLNRIMYGRHDHRSVYTIDANGPAHPIDESIEIDYERMIKFVIGSLTALIIDYNMFPWVENWGKQNLSQKEICDRFYQMFPFGFMGAHGCDVMHIGMTLSLPEIDQMLMRYPSLRVGFVINTAGYTSGSGGQHWMCLMLSNKLATLICSQASSFKVFNDACPKLQPDLQRLGFGMVHNPENIQRNDFSCGEFSVLSLMFLLCYDTIPRVIQAIGVDGVNALEGFNIEDIRAKIVGVV